jgi:hypothetical protein
LPVQTQNAFSSEDAERVAAKVSELKMKMPEYSIGNTKIDAPIASQLFVGVWAGKMGYNKGQGRQAVLIVTEASDDILLGFYLYGPPTSQSLSKGPAGYFSFASKVVDGRVQLQSGKTVWDVKITGKDELSIQVSEPVNKSVRQFTIVMAPVWRLMNGKQPAISRR